MNKLYHYTAAVVAAVVMSACGEHHHHHDEEHHHIQLTGYSSRLECFAETEPLSVGEENHILCHLTQLSDFKPLEDADVTISVMSKNFKAEAVTPGIYEAHCLFEKEGQGRMAVIVASQAFTDTIYIDKVCVYAEEHVAHEAAEAAEPSAANAVVFGKEMSWSIDFRTEQPVRRPLGHIVKTVAEVLPSPSDESILSARTAGIVHLASSSVTEGSSVSVGQAIASIDASATPNDNLTMRQRQAETEAERAHAELQRIEALRADRLVLESEVTAAKAAADRADAELKALKQGFTGGKQTVCSSQGGFLRQLLVKEGQYVEAGGAIAVITSSRTLQLKAEVPVGISDELPNLCDAIIGGQSLLEMGGRITSYGRCVKTGNPRIPVFFEVDNSSRFIPGQLLDANIIMRSAEEKLCVPSAAVLEQMGHYFVYVQVTPELFEKRLVETGVSDGRYTEVVRGLDPKERIVSTGAQLVSMQHAMGSVDPESTHHH